MAVWGPIRRLYWDEGLVALGGMANFSGLPMVAELCRDGRWRPSRRRGVFPPLDIQVLYVERVVFDELSARFHVFDHQRGEDGLALGDVFQPDLQEGAALGIHLSLPELLGAHYSEAFVALDDVLFAAFV